MARPAGQLLTPVLLRIGPSICLGPAHDNSERREIPNRGRISNRGKVEGDTRAEAVALMAEVLKGDVLGKTPKTDRDSETGSDDRGLGMQL